MEENIFFLKYIYQDDLFIIDETKGSIHDPEVEKVKSEPGSLVQEIPSIVEEAPPISFFGQNSKGILILINDASNDLISQSDLDFLMKIIEGGLKYSKNDFALVNLAKWPIKQVLEEIPFKYLLLFGKENSVISNNAPLYKIIEKDGKKKLCGDRLAEINMDQTKKKLLWSALKTMFNI